MFAAPALRPEFGRLSIFRSIIKVLMQKIKKFLTLPSDRLDLLGDPSQINPATAKKMGEFMTTSEDPFADLFAVRASKRVLENKPVQHAKQKTNHPPKLDLAH